MNVTQRDYLQILTYYNIKKCGLSHNQIKKEAENILATKLCRCIKIINHLEHNLPSTIPICNNSIIEKGIYTSMM